MFTKAEDLIYLNSGSLSRTPSVVFKKVISELEMAELNPTRYLFGAWQRLWGAQSALARLLNADPKDIYLRPNVTMAMNDFLMNVDLPPQSEVLISDMEYGAIANICRRRAERDGMTLRALSIPFGEEVMKTLSPDELMEAIIRQFSPRTKMLMLSHIITGNGLVVPILPMAEECRKRGIIFAIDGAHGPGAVEMDFSEFKNVDFYGGNVHKWLMGPKGTGFGWIAPHLQESLFPQHSGWTTFETPGLFQKFGADSRFAGRFLWSSTLDFPPFMALTELEKFWFQHFSEIRDQLRLVQDGLREFSARVGWQELSPQHPELRGPLVSFRLPDHLSSRGFALMDQLEKDFNLVVSTPILKGRHELRLSPHVYNEPKDLERAADILRKL